jgi:uncharacterized protein YcbK (DUF882 family)
MKLIENSDQRISKNKITRRKFCKLGVLTAISTALPSKTMAAVEGFLSEQRVLSFYNLHTKEDLCVVYCKNGKYIPEALAKIYHILRDHYSGVVKPIDTSLLDLLFAIQKRLDTLKPFHIISGYRTPRTNAYLKKHYKGVSKQSLHMYGKAVDVRLPGISLITLRRAAYDIKAGGIGFYPRSNFVHIDVGEVRYW